MLRLGIKRTVKLLITMCGAIFLIAGPAASEPSNVIFVLDASGSMWGQIDGKAKIDIARDVMNGLVDGLPQDLHVGLFAYGHRSKGDCRDIEMLMPVGPADPKAIKAKIAALSPKGKTPLSAAVQQAAQALRYTEEKATVILVSDGLETCDADPCKLAAELAMSGVDFTVHVVGFDISKEEQARLSCLADRTGGLFLAAGNAQSLRDALTKTVAKVKEPPKPIVDDPGKAELKAPASVPAGSEFEFEWKGPDSRNDYIAISLKAQKDHEYRDYVYSKKGSPARLRAPGDPGDYELRYVHAQTKKVIGRNGIKVTPVQASVRPPASEQVARELVVAWEGPDYEGDYVTIARPEHSDSAYEHYSYTRRGNPAKLQAPSDPGKYEVRYVLGTDNKVLARAPISIEKADAQVQVPESADVSAQFEVHWQGPDNKNDYISIAVPGEAGGSYKTYAYTNKGNPVKLKAPSDPGAYEVRYVLGQGNKILARSPITILGVSAQVEAPGSCNAASEFEVKWQGPNNQEDYISIALPGKAGGEYKTYAYTKKGSPLKLKAPSDPGEYEVRYILGQGSKILARQTITVQAVSASVRPPESVPAGADFSVEWQGPSTQGDYISVAPPESSAGQYDNYAYTRNGNPAKLAAPGDPGPYEVRYILGQDDKLLTKAAITVTPVSATVSAPAEVAAEAKFAVEWQGPGYAGDYVAIALPGSSANEYESYIYTKSGTPGSLTAPSKPGAYEVRYIMERGRKILGKTQIIVK